MSTLRLLHFVLLDLTGYRTAVQQSLKVFNTGCWMVRIVHVIESFGGGTLSILCDIANQQVIKGHRVFVLHAIREETPATWRTLFDIQITCVQLPMVRAIRPLADARAAYLLLAQLRKIQPDIIHLHSSKAGALGRLLSLVYPRPRWFFSPHGLSFLQRDTTPSAYLRQATNKVKRGLGSQKSLIKSKLFLLIEKILAWIPVPLIACSQSEAAEIRAHLTQRVVVVDNAVNLSHIPSAVGIPGPIRIGTSGRVVPARDPALFAAVAQQLIRPDVTFTWIGGGEKKSESQLQSAGVRVTGWLTREQALAQLASLDLYIQTSQSEGMPVAVIEAMAAGLPVIATDIVGNCDLIKNGENGWLVHDVAGFVERLETLINNKHECVRMGLKAKEYAFAHHSLDQMVDKLNQVYGINH